MYAAPNKGFLKRILNYLSFMLSSIVLGIPLLPKIDVVIASSPQFFVAVAGYVISVLKRVPFVFEVRDVWPEEIVAIGAIKNRFIIGFLERVEMFLYRRAKLIVAVAQGTIEILTSRGVPRDKIVWLPNGICMREFTQKIDRDKIREKINLNGEFLVSYVGTHGMAHRLQTVLSAAEKLKSNPRIKFLMVGDGAEKESLLDLAQSLDLNNVTFLPQLPHEEAIGYYKISDACLVPLRKAALFTKNIPSKIYEIMASERPVLLGAKGESMELVEQAGAGLVFEPEDADSLAESILKLYENRNLAKQLGENGYNYAASHCRRAKIADEYVGHLIEIGGC
jgi:glycosyltransferase involved in cell wall biosynthesis